MNMEKKNYEAPQKSEKGSGSDHTAEQAFFKRGEEAYGQAEEAVSDAYDKTYEKARSYSSDNPGKSILIALGIGVGLGFILASSTRRPGVTGRIARPVVNALSDIALDYWR